MYQSINYDQDILMDVFLFNLLSSKSPAIKHNSDKTILWTFIVKSIKDDNLIRLMIFNLSFNIAPLHTYIKYYEDELKELNLKRYDKQCLASIVAILFKSLGYTISKRNYRKDAMIKYAAFFTKEVEMNCE
jgi:hypothetical protein